MLPLHDIGCIEASNLGRSLMSWSCDDRIDIAEDAWLDLFTVMLVEHTEEKFEDASVVSQYGWTLLDHHKSSSPVRACSATVSCCEGCSIEERAAWTRSH